MCLTSLFFGQKGEKMNYLQNLHTHTNYCDGKDTAEEIVLTAIEKDFTSIGFSEHSQTPYPSSLKAGEATRKYKQEIRLLKEKHKGIIDIYCGLEFDSCSKVDISDYDYIIGSVHYINGVTMDRDADYVRNLIDTYYDGDSMKYVKAYYEELATLHQYEHVDIIGHFDLLTKHKENVAFFDDESPLYKKYAIEAAEALAGKISLFEVNTGAIARGYRTTPYPSMFLIKELKRLGFGAVITSDCHDREKLDCGFCDATELLKSCGYKEKFILTDNGFIPVPL